MLSQSPLVSVIIPVHNREMELKRAIGSVLNQSYVNLEILVMDDASSIDIPAVISGFNNEKIHYFRSDLKSNANVMRNKGIDNAKGELIGFLDSDDEWMPDHLTVKVEELRERNADGIFGSSFIDNGTSKRYIPSVDMPSHLHPVEYLLSIGFAGTPSFLVRTEAAKNIMFDEQLHRHQDFDFFSRFAVKYVFVASWKPTVIIHWTDGEVRQKHAGSEIRFIQHNFKNIQPKIYKTYHLKRLLAWRSSGNEKVIAHYKQETLRYIHHLPFIEYCSVFPQRTGVWGFLMNWIGYSSLSLKRKFSQPKRATLLEE